MSEERNDLTGETVHGLKNEWRFKSWDEQPDKSPKVVGWSVDEPEPAQKPAPVKGEDWVSGAALNNMADHLRRAKRLKITIDQAKSLILNDEETKVIYKNHQSKGKF